MSDEPASELTKTKPILKPIKPRRELTDRDVEISSEPKSTPKDNEPDTKVNQRAPKISKVTLKKAVNDAQVVPRTSSSRVYNPLKFFNPANLYYKITGSFIMVQPTCFTCKHKFHPDLTTQSNYDETGDPVLNEDGTPATIPVVWYADVEEVRIAMALAAGLYAHPDDVSYVNSEGTSLTEEQRLSLWEAQLCCRTTIHTFPRFGGNVSPKKNVVQLKFNVTEPIDHIQFQEAVIRVYGEPVYPHYIQVSENNDQSDHVRDYAGNLSIGYINKNLKNANVIVLTSL